MKTSRYTEEQVASTLRLAGSGTPFADICRQMGIAEATFYLWKKKYGSLGAAEVRELRQMREENARLKRLVADLTLDKHILQEVLRQKRLRPARRRERAQWIHDRFQVSTRRACALGDVCPNTWYYRSRARDASVLRMRIREIAQARPRFGYVRIWIMLRREGWPDNKKRVHRLYRLEGLQVRLRARRKKRLILHRGTVPPATGLNQYWSMDFVHDQLASGRTFRVLTVIDQWSRESVRLEAHVSLTGRSVVDALEAVSAERPLPRAITVDHGTAFTSTVLDEWAYRRGVALDFIRPGKPVENAFIESFNGRLRDECLNARSYVDITHARQLLNTWRHDYNHQRPHGALGHLTPSEYVERSQQQDPEAARLQLSAV